MREISTLGLSREQWLELRRQGIGGSDAAAILGVSRFKSPFGVYCDKIGLSPKEEDDNPVLKIGTYLEEYVAKLFTEASGLKVHKVNKILIHPTYDWMRANVDRAVVGEKAILECKTTTHRNNVDWDAGEIAPEYFCQVQQYLAVTGYDHGYLGVLFREDGAFKWFQISRDEQYIDALSQAEAAFWHRVVNRLPPDPDGLDNDTQTLKRLYPVGDGSEMDLTTISDVMYNRMELDRNIKTLEKERDRLDNIVRATLGDAVMGSAGSVSVTYKPQTRTGVDTEKLKTDFPTVYAQVQKQSVSRTMRYKEVK